MSDIKLPPHEPTIAIADILSGYIDIESIDVWESIQAYAEVYTRETIALNSAQPAVVPKHAADWFHDMREVLFDIATSDVICDRPEHAFVTVAIDRDTLSRAAILSATDTKEERKDE